jgi:hypothetical protein
VRIYRREAPTSEDLAAAPRPNFWTIGAEDGCLVLQGLVTGHPLLDEGANIRTSALMWLSDDRRVARTVSHFYVLGALFEGGGVAGQLIGWSGTTSIANAPPSDCTRTFIARALTQDNSRGHPTLRPGSRQAGACDGHVLWIDALDETGAATRAFTPR